MDTPGQGLGSDGLPRPNGRAGEMGRAYGLSTERKGIDFFFFIFEFIFNEKTISEKSRNCFKGTKITQKISEIQGKFPGTH
jgi:hypothetical protein